MAKNKKVKNKMEKEKAVQKVGEGASFSSAPTCTHFEPLSKVREGETVEALFDKYSTKLTLAYEHNSMGRIQYHDNLITRNGFVMAIRELSLPASVEVSDEEKYWHDLFLKVTSHWYGKEKPNMAQLEFIAVKERQAPKTDERREEEKPNYEYELFFKSEPNDSCKIDGWYPIATDRIRKPEQIEKYIESGLLRRIKL